MGGQNGIFNLLQNVNPSGLTTLTDLQVNGVLTTAGPINVAGNVDIAGEVIIGGQSLMSAVNTI